ncbi:MAG: hypothetical protein IKH13_06035 [Clostridia bacterium]|nr:hypothetical protein [Clostridia bacterium]
MPHSSGGGSHGGGGHGGGGSHGGGSSGTRSMPTASRKYFAGATPYVRYHNGRTDILYADRDITKTKKSDYVSNIVTIVFISLIMALFAFGSFSSISGVFRAPKKLSTDYDTTIIIEDNLGVITDRAAMEKALSDFLDVTGITPSVMTVTNESWRNYSSLENYAYDLYVNTFDDEKHWLIVYSQPAVTGSGGFVDWYWEGMQGDDTDNIITDYSANLFTESLQKYLTADTKYSVERAIRLAFEQITPQIMQRHVNKNDIKDAVLVLAVMGAMWGFPVVFSIMNLVKMKNYKDYQKVPSVDGKVLIQETCDYCGGVYVVGTCLNCPHCGASVKAYNPIDPGRYEYDRSRYEYNRDGNDE